MILENLIIIEVNAFCKKSEDNFSGNNFIEEFKNALSMTVQFLGNY